MDVNVGEKIISKKYGPMIIIENLGMDQNYHNIVKLYI